MAHKTIKQMLCPIDLLLGIYFTDIPTQAQYAMYTRLFISVLFIPEENWKQSNVSQEKTS